MKVLRPTEYPEINTLLEDLLTGIRSVVGDRLVGMYLYGSLVWGDFDYEISDIDLLAVLSENLISQDARSLQQMHADLARAYPSWDDRLEVQYCAQSDLWHFRKKRHALAVISPGEPFHLVSAGTEWLLNWYFVQEYGVTLYGPPPSQLVPPIAEEEFLQAVRQHARAWSEYVQQTKDSRPYQSYAILTMCRALYTLRHGKQVSKRQAARWAQEVLPQYSSLINQAWQWRQDYRSKATNHRETYPVTVEFVQYVIALIQQMSVNNTP